MNILYADYFLPEPDTSAGALRVWELLRIFQEQGHAVTCLGLYPGPARYRDALAEIGVRAVCDDTERLRDNPLRLRRFLQAGAFDAAICAHYDVYGAYAPYLRAYLPQCPVTLDTVDIHFLRVGRQAELDPSLRPKAAQARRAELAAVQNADAVWTVTAAERDTFQSLLPDAPPFWIVPTLHRAEACPPPFAARRGIAFLGGYKHAPNVDAVQWFLGEVLPRLCLLVPDAPVLIAGSHPPPEFDRYHALPNVEVLGFVDSHRALLQGARVGIAPLRFGAGMKGKIAEYLCCGLPCVTTGVGAEGMDFLPGQDVLIADDPQEFAEAVASLYENAALWAQMSQAGLAHMNTRYAPETVAPIVADALQKTAVRPIPLVRRGGGLLRVLLPDALAGAKRAVQRAASRLGLGRLRSKVLRRVAE